MSNSSGRPAVQPFIAKLVLLVARLLIRFSITLKCRQMRAGGFLRNAFAAWSIHATYRLAGALGAIVSAFHAIFPRLVIHQGQD